MGNDRFDGIQAQTGMSPNLLTQRLKSMEDNGLIERRVYQERPRRHSYCITDKARELDGMMLALRLWGMRHCGLDPRAEGAVTMKHRRTGAVVGVDWQPEEADQPFTFSQVETRVNPAWAAERAAQRGSLCGRTAHSGFQPRAAKETCRGRVENGKRKARSAKARFCFREGLSFYEDPPAFGTWNAGALRDRARMTKIGL